MAVIDVQGLIKMKKAGECSKCIFAPATSWTTTGRFVLRAAVDIERLAEHSTSRHSRDVLMEFRTGTYHRRKDWPGSLGAIVEPV